MSLAVRELSRLLSADDTVLGVVTGFSGAMVVVSTPRGLIQARPVGALVQGDGVTVQAGMASKVGKPKMTYSV